jgi:nucleotide-binding universal stress UspA family protein
LIRTIAHPTDFSHAGGRAFAHALCLALVTRSGLCLMHIKETGEEDSWSSFPHVRETLARWGLMGAHEAHAQIEAKLGVHVSKVEIAHDDPTRGLLEFILGHRPDLMVLATHGRDGLKRYLSGSVSEEIARRTQVPALFIGPEAQGFVDEASGEMRLTRVLVPVAHDPAPQRAVTMLADLLAPLGVPPSALQLLHVGDTPPKIAPHAGAAWGVELTSGPVVETILDLAAQRLVDLIAMPTAGHRGVLDALKGSTTERVVRHAPCPLLALHAV